MPQITAFSTIGKTFSNGLAFLPGDTFVQTFPSQAAGLPVEFTVGNTGVATIDLRVRVLRGTEVLADVRNPNLPTTVGAGGHQCFVMALTGERRRIAVGDMISVELTTNTPPWSIALLQLNQDVPNLQKGNLSGYPNTPFNTLFSLSLTETLPLNLTRDATEAWVRSLAEQDAGIRQRLIDDPMAFFAEISAKRPPSWTGATVYAESSTRMVIVHRCIGWSPSNVADPNLGLQNLLCDRICRICHSHSGAMAQLSADPRTFLSQRLGLTVPSEVTIEFHDEPPNKYVIVLPYAAHYANWQPSP